MFVTFGTLANVTLLDGGFFYSNTFNPGHPNVLRAIVSVSFLHLTLYLACRRLPVGGCKKFLALQKKKRH